MARPAREPVAPNDAVWLQDTPTNRMIINGIWVSDHIDLATARDVFRARVLDLEGGARYPRFFQRVVREGGRWFWVDDPAFDIARHMVSSPLAGPTDATGLQAYISSIAHEGLPADRPRWRIEHVEHYGEGQSAFVVRIHHAMGDGIAIVPVLLALMDELEPGAAPRANPVRSVVGALKTAVLAPLLAPAVLLKRVLWSPDRHALHGPPVSGRKRVAWTRPLDLARVKQVKDRFAATVNDVLMAMVSGALARYLEAHAGETVPHIRVSMPVNMRGPGTPLKMENRFAAVPLTLPAGPRHLPDRLAAVKRTMDALKDGLDPLVIYGVVNVFLTSLPYGVSRRLIDFFANKCTCVVTNVPGPAGPLAFGGRRVRQLMFWVPQRADIGVGISVLTLAGSLQIGVIADESMVADPGMLVAALETEFEELADHLG